jgi:hypothetical protein
MSRDAARFHRWPTILALGAVACVSGNVSVRSHYQNPEPEPAPAPKVSLISAQLTRYGDEPVPLTGEQGGERMVEGSEATQDAVLLVFGEQLDPLTLDPRAFGILRGDGRRVRPIRAILAPADEGDENRSVTLIGNFGSEASPPVAVHVIGTLHAESGAVLQGLDADISSLTEPDRPVVIERLQPDETRCPGAAQMLRSYWSDTLTGVGADDLAGVDLRLADGRIVHPTDFDDQARRDDDPPCAEPFTACLGPTDDNVLDLCVTSTEAIVHLHFSAGLFRDAGGRATAAADVALPMATGG